MSRRDRDAREQLGVGLSRLRWRDLLHEAVLSLSRHPARALLTAIGTVLGAAAFVATLGISSTMGKLVNDSFDVRRATEVRVTPVDPEVPGGWLAEDRLETLRELNGVVAAGRRLSLGDGTVRRVLGGEEEPVRVLGADPGALAAMEPRVTLGRLYDGFHEQNQIPTILLSRPIADRLKISRVGVAVYLGDRPFSVIGIFDDVARRAEAMVSVVIPASVADDLAQSSTTVDADVLIATVPGAAQLIGAQAPYALWPENPAAVQAIAPPDPRTLRREVEGSVTRSSLLVSLIALAIGAVSIANAATAGIGARVPEIGLRRAVGGRPMHIFLQLLAETTALGVLGGVLGVLLGVSVTAMTALVNGWTPVLDWRTALIAALSSAACGLLAGLWPAARAMKIAPITALQR